MGKQGKTILLVAALVIVITAAAFAYNRLSALVEPETPFALAEEEGEVSSETAAESSEPQTVPAPDFTFTDADGQEYRLSDFIGRPVVLNFWASWCPPCKSEMPDFDKVYQELGEEVQFLMVDLVDGSSETVETGAAFVQKEGFAFPVFYDTAQEGAYLYGIASIPTTFFIDEEGLVVAGANGMLTEASLRKGIELITTAEG